MIDDPSIGELFAGYGGLGQATMAALGRGRVAWYSDVCKFDKDGSAGHHEPHRAPCSIMAHHYPDVPNLGDITRIDWSTVDPVDILTGGSPCQDLSHAGKRAGMTEGTRSNLWVSMREAIAELRPGLVIWENVRGAYSANAASDLEPCAGCVGDRSGEPVLRALGRVLGDLSDLGYDAIWHGLRAADVGAPHGRFRVFVAAYSGPDGLGFLGQAHDLDRRRASGDVADRCDPAPADTGSEELSRRAGLRAGGPGGLGRGRSSNGGHPTGLLPTPTSRDHKGRNQRDDETCLTGALLPTPSASDGTGGKTSRSGDRKDEPLLGGISRLLPTPMVGSSSPDAHGQISGQYRDQMVEAFARWGDYAAAIARWEDATRPAPDPTETGPKGSTRLAAAFSEWMMGLPEGWVTDVPDITRNEALKALGNGVVPQQAAAAIRWMIAAAGVAA